MKNCRDIQLDLSAYVDGELTPPQRAEVETHLTSCAHCQQELLEMKTLAMSVGALPRLRPAPQFLAEVRRKITIGDQARSTTWQDYIFRPLWLKVPLEVAALIVVIGLAIRVERPSPAYMSGRLEVAKAENDKKERKDNVSSAPIADLPKANEQKFGFAKEATPAGSASDSLVAPQAPSPAPLQSREERAAASPVLTTTGTGAGRQLQAEPATTETVTASLKDKQGVGGRRIPAIHGSELAPTPLAPLTGVAGLIQSIELASSKLGETIIIHARDFNDVQNQAQQLAKRCNGRVMTTSESTFFVELPQEYVAAFKLELAKTSEPPAGLDTGKLADRAGSTNVAAPPSTVGMGSGNGVLTGSAATNAVIDGLAPLSLRDEATTATPTTVLEIRVVPPAN